ncbi:MAG: hypothetical protein AAGB31_04345 [Bdellovibrio sp.]
MKIGLVRIMMVALMVGVGACSEVRNSSALDADLYGSDVTGSAAFMSARVVMVNQCFRCHGEWASYNEADFVTQGLVVAGSPSGSVLYQSLKGNDSGVTGTMPEGGNLSSDEMMTIKSWIAGM